MSAHTPTPWFANGPCDIVAKNPDGSGYIVLAHFTHTALPKKEKEANAAYIVRAVNSHAQLVEALTELADYLDDSGHKELPLTAKARSVLVLAEPKEGI